MEESIKLIDVLPPKIATNALHFVVTTLIFSEINAPVGGGTFCKGTLCTTFQAYTFYEIQTFREQQKRTKVKKCFDKIK